MMSYLARQGKARQGGSNCNDLREDGYRKNTTASEEGGLEDF